MSVDARSFTAAYLRHCGASRPIAVELGLCPSAITQRAAKLGLPGAVTLRRTREAEAVRRVLRRAFETRFGEPL